MRKSVLGLIVAMSLLAGSAHALQETPIPLLLRATGVTVLGSTQTLRDTGSGPKDVGIVVSITTTAIASAPTVLLTIQGRTPAGEWYDMGASTALAVAVGVPNVIYLHPGIATAANVAFSLPLPPQWRIKAVVGGTGSATFSVGVGRTN